MTQIAVAMEIPLPALNDGAPRRDRNWIGSVIAAEPFGGFAK